MSAYSTNPNPTSSTQLILC